MHKPTSDCRATGRKHPWPMVRLGDACTIEFGTRVRRKDSHGGDYPVYGGGGATFCWSTYNREDQCIVSRFAMSEECVRFVKGKFFLNDSGLSVRSDNQDLSQTYLDWVLYSKQPEIYALGRGAAQKNLDVEQFVDMMLPLPPLSVQHEIVARLERELAAVEKMKKGFEELAETAKAEFKAELKEVFEKQGQALASGRLGWRKLGEICENLDSKRVPITKSDREAGKYPYYGASGVVDWVSGYIFDGDYLLVSEDGANLIARSTPIAFSVSGKIWVNNHAHILAFSDLTTQRFVEFYFASIKIDDLVTGAAQPKLTQNALNSIEIPFPPLADQREVVSRLDSAKARAEKLEAKAREGVAVCETMRKAILKEAFE